jgi:hypothetical protein
MRLLYWTNRRRIRRLHVRLQVKEVRTLETPGADCIPTYLHLVRELLVQEPFKFPQ